MGSHKKSKRSRDEQGDEEMGTSRRDSTVHPERKTFSEPPKKIRESKHKRSKEKKVSEDHEHVTSSSKHSEHKSSSKKRKQSSYTKHSDREYVDRNDGEKYPKQIDRGVDHKDTERIKNTKQCDGEFIDRNDGAKYQKQSDRVIDRKDTDTTKYPKLSDRDNTYIKSKDNIELKQLRLNPEIEYEQRDKGDYHRQFERYWGDKPIKKNSDSYWNKYPIEEESREKHEIGPRYYSSKNEELVKKPMIKGVTDGTLKCDDSKTKKSTESMTTSQKKTVDLLTSKTGGAYIPPAKLRMMQSNITDKTSLAYQRIAWEALKKSIHGHINKVNTGNIAVIVRELFKENIVRGRGLLCRSIIQAQAASPTFTNVYAALVSVINSRFPNIAELLLNRCVIQFRRGFKRNDKATCISAATFIAHLFNQGVAHEILALELLSLLVESPTNDSIEVAIVFLKECGQKLTEVSKKGIDAIFDMLRNILHEGQLEKRVQYMIEVMFQVRKDDFKEYPSLVEELNLVDEEDQFTHLIALDEATDGHDILNVFKFDPEYEESEKKYKALRAVILDEGEGGSEIGDSSEDGSEEEGSSEEEEANAEKKELILDNTETNLVALRKTIYLTIHSSLDFEECAHKLLRMELKPGQEVEMCHMFLDCCAEQRTYEKFFGLLAQRFCQINRMYIGPFEQIFRDSYATIYRLETNKLRNVAKFFAHLLFTDAISWDVLATIRLNEEDTSSSSRIFIKILFQELSEYMGLLKLNQRVKDPTMQLALDGLFPRDNPKNTRFAINFFTSIGLGGLTDELREHLKAQPKKSVIVPQLVEALSSSSSTTESSSEESSSESSSDSSSESSDSSSEKKSKKKSNKNKNASQKCTIKKSPKSRSSKQKKR